MGAGVAFCRMRTVEQWFGEYGESHSNPRNELLHIICVPPIVMTVIGFIWAIPVPAAFAAVSPWLNWATITIALSWAAVHTTFALHYAHDYYRHPPGGLQFPSGDKEDHADYWDFVYFSFVIGMTAQVSDVGITDKTIRRTATAHGIVSFIYNTALLALTVNIAASAISN